MYNITEDSLPNKFRKVGENDMTVYDLYNIESIISGYWYRKPTKGWFVDSISISEGQVNMDKEKNTLFIAIDSDTWHKGSKNASIYAGWDDTHVKVKHFERKIKGIIAARPIEELDESIPQYITTNTYDAIRAFATYAYQNFTGKMIAITGTAGKSTSKNLLNFLLSKHVDVIATRGNHNSRTGVPLTIACGISQPDYLVVESAISGLWMRPHGIMNDYPPTIALITSIDGGQNKSPYETAVIKAKIAEGMHHSGTVVLNRDMKEFPVVYEQVRKYNNHIITYGFHEEADCHIIDVKETKEKSQITASILGEEIKGTTKLNGQAMIQNIVGVLTILKLMDIPLTSVLDHIVDYMPSEGVHRFENYTTYDNKEFTLLDDSWNATGIAMIEAIKLFGNKVSYYQGKKIAILGRIENLGEKEAKNQHEAIVQPLIESGIELVFAHGPEMKYTLKQLPEEMIGGYFESSKQLAQHVAHIIDEDDFILLKGSPRSSDFKLLKKYLLDFASRKKERKSYSHYNRWATGSGAATFNISTDEKVGVAGNQQVVQNEGLANVLLIQHVLENLFSKDLNLVNQYVPGNQELKENKSLNAIKLEKNTEVSLANLLTAAILNRSPNALLMIANQVVGSNRKTMSILKEKTKELGINEQAVLNVTGRRISNLAQKVTLDDLYKAGRLLFNQYPFMLDFLSVKTFTYGDTTYTIPSNLYNYGFITHGLFFGTNDSMAIVLSKFGEENYITVVVGANDAFHRDQLIIESLQSIEKRDKKMEIDIRKYTGSDYTMNIIGDTYFGEFYSDRRVKNNRTDALMTEGRAYSFNGIRSMLRTGDFNICNFEAALSSQKEQPMKKRKPFVLYSDPNVTAESLKQENIHLATLANNHLMDCGREGLEETIQKFNQANISTIGAGVNQDTAERPFIKQINDTRIAIFNAYWYRRPMYREFDFYATGNEPGVACLSGRIFEQIKAEKASYPNGKILVIAHWGVDFKSVHQKQREYAHSLVDAGADIIIGHGAHMIQEIEKNDSSIIAYSIGNGVFNSDGEYNRRFVAPYSLFAQIKMNQNEMELRLYPMYCNNLTTFWQPRLVTEDEFHHCTLMMKAYGSCNLMSKKENGNFYYSFPIQV